MTNVRPHRCDDHLQTDLIALGANQMRTEPDAAQLQLIVWQQVVQVQDAIHAREIVRFHVHRSHVLDLILDAVYENANLVGGQ